MRHYHVPPNLLPDHFGHARNSVMAEAVRQLIERYGFRHKRILSLGGGRSFEERWLAELGPNDVTVIDTDPEGIFEPVLATGAVGSLHYAIGNALEPWPEPFD